MFRPCSKSTLRWLTNKQLIGGWSTVLARNALLGGLFGAASAIVAVSDGVGRYVEHWGVPSGRVHVLPNGVDTNRFQPHLEPAIAAEPDTCVIGFVGTLKPWHGLLTLVDAFAIAHRSDPRLRLLIVGDGPQRTAVEQRIAETGIAQSVRLAGAVDPSAMPAMLASMDIAVAPYESMPDFYFSPLKLFEYMASGLAVVASAAGQIPEIVNDGANGLLVRPGDDVALATTILRVAGDASLRDRLGRAARLAVEQRHTWDAIAATVLHLPARPADGRVVLTA